MDLRVPPQFCKYANGPCDQEIDPTSKTRAVFLYSSDPPFVGDTIELTVEGLRSSVPGVNWKTWKDFQVTGMVIFCEICKNIRYADAVVADVTRMNFNVMFEIGYAIGLGQAVIPIRDTTVHTDKRHFDELGIFDVIGYINFQNSETLAREVAKRLDNLKPLPIRDCPLRVRLKT